MIHMKSGRNLSLRTRIFIFFFGILFLMICSYIFVITNFIMRSTVERLDGDYETILSETCDTVENLLWNLTLTSQQLLENDEIAANLMGCQEAADPYERQVYYAKLLEPLSFLTMSNTDIALTYFYDETAGSCLYNSLPADRIPSEPVVLYQNSVFCFQGPCASQSSFIGNPVLVLNRSQVLPNGKRVTLSVETGYYSLDSPLQAAARKDAWLVFVNHEGQPVYSTLPDDLDVVRTLSELSSGSKNGLRSFSRQSAQGWTVHVIVPSSVYTRDYRAALRDFILCTILLAVLVGFLALYFWKSVCRPLQLFDRQLSLLLSEETPEKSLHSSIPEYEHLLQRIADLQKQVQQMLKQAVVQERNNSRIQLEKLRAQINPHFLMNTLNTLHWMALMNGQKEMDGITQSLSHLLSYNLDKENRLANLKGEIDAVKEYTSLQKVRYAFHFDLRIPNDPAGLNYPCPKFILQPLVENSLTHGYRENMEILLEIKVDEQIRICLSDTGTGMEEGTLKRLQAMFAAGEAGGESVSAPAAAAVSASAASRSSNRFGIGLQYVAKSLREFFHDDFHFRIQSRKNEGTDILLIIPKLKGAGYHAENTDR